MNRMLPSLFSKYFFMRKYSTNFYLRNHVPNKVDDMLQKIGQCDKKKFIENVYKKNRFIPLEIEARPYNIVKQELNAMAKKNHKFTCYYGNGFYPSHMIECLKTNFLMNPNFYSAYIPYQSEISQGRLELLFNYQTMIANLTNMDIANCSLLDESSASAKELYHFIIF